MSSLNPFRGGLVVFVGLWLLFLAASAAVVLAGNAVGRTTEAVNAVIMTLAFIGHAYLLPALWSLNTQIVATHDFLEILFRLPPGSPIPDHGVIRVPLNSHLKYLRSLGINARNGARDSLAKMSEMEWHETCARARAIGAALISAALVGTFIGVNEMAQGIVAEIGKANADVTEALLAALGGMATATQSSILGGVFGCLSLLFIAAIMTARIEVYGSALRMIYEFADFGDDWFTDLDSEEGGAQ